MKTRFGFDEILEALPAGHATLLDRIARTAVARGTALFLVGGPVRDLLLGRALRDLDLLIDADPLPLAQAVAAAHPTLGLAIEAPTRFGTLRLATSTAAVDLARARRETYERPGALPEVHPGSLEEDVLRRDYSINALVLPVEPGERGRAHEVVDLVGGVADLAEKRLRCLHPRSFHDDPTRALRGARLALRLGLRFDRPTRNALRDALRDGAFGAVSGERFRRELALVFEEPRQGVDAGRILQLLSELHVLAALEPGLSLPRDRQAPLRRLSRSLEAPEWPLGRHRPWVAGLSIWLAGLPAVTRRRALERFAIRGEQAARILGFAAEGERLLRGIGRARGRGAVDALLAEQSEEALLAVFSLAEVAARRRIVRFCAEDRRRRAPVVGGDLIELGIAGPDVGRGLARIRAAFLDGEIANREEALVLAQELARRSLARPKRAGRARRTARGGRAASASRAVAPGGAILDTAPRRRARAPIDAPKPLPSTEPDPGSTHEAPHHSPEPKPSRRAPRTESTR